MLSLILITEQNQKQNKYLCQQICYSIYIALFQMNNSIIIYSERERERENLLNNK